MQIKTNITSSIIFKHLNTYLKVFYNNKYNHILLINVIKKYYTFIENKILDKFK